MSQNDGLNRRAFLQERRDDSTRGRGRHRARPLAAAAAGRPRLPRRTASSTSTRRTTASAPIRPSTIQQIRTYGKDSVRSAWASPTWTSAPRRRSPRRSTERLQHENWGYLDMGGGAEVVHRRHRRAGTSGATASTSIPRPVVITTGVHPGIIAALQDVLAPGQQGAAADADLQRLLRRPDRHRHQSPKRAR